MWVKGNAELAPIVEELIQARQKGDLQYFIDQKEKIAEKFRPIWAVETKKLREQQEKDRADTIGWIKKSIGDVLRRIYAYFIPV